MKFCDLTLTHALCTYFVFMGILTLALPTWSLNRCGVFSAVGLILLQVGLLCVREFSAYLPRERVGRPLRTHRMKLILGLLAIIAGVTLPMQQFWLWIPIFFYGVWSTPLAPDYFMEEWRGQTT